MNGGPGLPCLLEAVYSYLCFGLQQGKIISKVDEICDDKVRTHLLKVCNIDDNGWCMCIYRFVMPKTQLHCRIC